MIAAAHQTMMAKHGVPPPWDYRVEYIDCTTSAAYCVLVMPVSAYGDDEEQSVVIGTDLTSSVDRKMFGTAYHFGMSIYGGRWRPSGWSDWPSTGPQVSSYQKVRFSVSISNQSRIFSPEGSLLTSHNMILAQPGRTYKRNSSYSTTFPNDGVQRYHHRAFGAMRDNGDWTVTDAIGNESTTFGAHRIYDFFRKLNGSTTHHMIPCVSNGVAGFYEEVGGVFYPSKTSTAFTAGPQVADDYQSYQV